MGTRRVRGGPVGLDTLICKRETGPGVDSTSILFSKNVTRVRTEGKCYVCPHRYSRSFKAGVTDTTGQTGHRLVGNLEHLIVAEMKAYKKHVFGFPGVSV